MKMDFRHRLACISGIILMITLASCDPIRFRYPEYCCELIFADDAEYPISLHFNIDLQRAGSVFVIGEDEYIIDSKSSFHLIESRFFPTKKFCFQDIWKPYEGHQIYCRVYRLNPDTLEEEELLEEWKDGNGFFDESYWDLKMDHGMHGGAHGYDIYEWTFHYPPAREKMASTKLQTRVICL